MTGVYTGRSFTTANKSKMVVVERLPLRDGVDRIFGVSLTVKNVGLLFYKLVAAQFETYGLYGFMLFTTANKKQEYFYSRFS